MLGEQLGRAAVDLRTPGGPSAEVIHQIRRRIKRSRSLLRLAQADLGASVARHANAELRSVGAALATQRDADALVETVDRLSASEPAGDAAPAREPVPEPDPSPELLASLAVVRAVLVERAQVVRAGPAADRATLLGAAMTLERLVRWLDRVPSRADGWAALGPGMARQHRRGRRAYRHLGDHPTAERLHEWRKRVKDLWYQERLLRRLWPEAQRPVIQAADHLAGLLGFDHDLALLVDLLEGGVEVPQAGDVTDDPIAHVDADDRARVAAAATERRQNLQVRAHRLGALLYADPAEAWQERHGAWWDAAVVDPASDGVTA